MLQPELLKAETWYVLQPKKENQKAKSVDLKGCFFYPTKHIAPKTKKPPEKVHQSMKKK